MRIFALCQCADYACASYVGADEVRMAPPYHHPWLLSPSPKNAIIHDQLHLSGSSISDCVTHIWSIPMAGPG